MFSQALEAAMVETLITLLLLYFFKSPSLNLLLEARRTINSSSKTRHSGFKN